MIRTLVVSAAMVLLSASSLSAQYFGRNKVEYRDFDFRILATEHFDVYYYPREERAARIAAQLAERWYARFSTLLDHEFTIAAAARALRQPGRVRANERGVRHAAGLGRRRHRISRRRVTMPFAPTLAETNRVLGHEIVHAFQFDIARRHGGDTGQPLWFIEGMAEYLSRGSLDSESSLWLRDAVLSDRVPAKQSAAAASSRRINTATRSGPTSGRFGDDVVEKALKPGAKQRRMKDRMRHATGEELDALYDGWRVERRARYTASGPKVPSA